MAVTVDLDIVLKAASFVLSVAALIVAWFASRRREVDTRMKQVETRLHAGDERMEGHDLRLQALEQSVAGMPGKDDLHALRLTLSEMGGDMKAIRATMKGMADSLHRTESIVGRHEDHLRGDP